MKDNLADTLVIAQPVQLYDSYNELEQFCDVLLWNGRALIGDGNMFVSKIKLANLIFQEGVLYDSN